MQIASSWAELLQARDVHFTKDAPWHGVSIPLMAASMPLAGTVVGLPAASALYTFGWSMQVAATRIATKDVTGLVHDAHDLVAGLALLALQSARVALRVSS